MSDQQMTAIPGSAYWPELTVETIIEAMKRRNSSLAYETVFANKPVSWFRDHLGAPFEDLIKACHGDALIALVLEGVLKEVFGSQRKRAREEAHDDEPKMLRTSLRVLHGCTVCTGPPIANVTNFMEAFVAERDRMSPRHVRVPIYMDLRRRQFVQALAETLSELVSPTGLHHNRHNYSLLGAPKLGKTTLLQAIVRSASCIQFPNAAVTLLCVYLNMLDPCTPNGMMRVIGDAAQQFSICDEQEAQRMVDAGSVAYLRTKGYAVLFVVDEVSVLFQAQRPVLHLSELLRFAKQDSNVVCVLCGSQPWTEPLVYGTPDPSVRDVVSGLFPHAFRTWYKHSQYSPVALLPPASLQALRAFVTTTANPMQQQWTDNALMQMHCAVSTLSRVDGPLNKLLEAVAPVLDDLVLANEDVTDPFALKSVMLTSATFPLLQECCALQDYGVFRIDWPMFAAMGPVVQRWSCCHVHCIAPGYLAMHCNYRLIPWQLSWALRNIGVHGGTFAQDVFAAAMRRPFANEMKHSSGRGNLLMSLESECDALVVVAPNLDGSPSQRALRKLHKPKFHNAQLLVPKWYKTAHPYERFITLDDAVHHWWRIVPDIGLDRVAIGQTEDNVMQLKVGTWSIHRSTQLVTGIKDKDNSGGILSRLTFGCIVWAQVTAASQLVAARTAEESAEYAELVQNAITMRLALLAEAHDNTSTTQQRAMEFQHGIARLAGKSVTSHLLSLCIVSEEAHQHLSVGGCCVWDRKELRPLWTRHASFEKAVDEAKLL
eukprot:TRINITY_DN11357_c0_g1_i1.p1 TRINITY_DN11357_c0_g1~~TRINITY_DN11357_c0_g1_i1.p1  ORF type:complete len:770 (+),score=145.38 TRINITY_DN11357_c0_g1_i1:150-2459(+)